MVGVRVAEWTRRSREAFHSCFSLESSPLKSLLEMIRFMVPVLYIEVEF